MKKNVGTYKNCCHTVWEDSGCDSKGGSQGGRGAQALNYSDDKTKPDEPVVRLEIVQQPENIQIRSSKHKVRVKTYPNKIEHTAATTIPTFRVGFTPVTSSYKR
jgi:hypothetical protein